MDKKTIGEIAHNSNPDRQIMKAWDDLTPATQTLYEVMASAVWDEAVEECAKKLASLKHEYEMNEDTAPAPDASLWSGAIHAVEAMENVLRSLKHGCHERPETAEGSVSPQAALQTGSEREAE